MAREQTTEVRALLLDRTAVGVLDRTDGLRWRDQVDHGAGQVAELEVEEAPVPNDVAHDRTLALAAESAHAVLHVGEEALPWLLAVVADVDAAFELARDHPCRRLLGESPESLRVDRLALALLDEQFDELA